MLMRLYKIENGLTIFINPNDNHEQINLLGNLFKLDKEKTEKNVIKNYIRDLFFHNNVFSQCFVYNTVLLKYSKNLIFQKLVLLYDGVLINSQLNQKDLLQKYLLFGNLVRLLSRLVL